MTHGYLRRIGVIGLADTSGYRRRPAPPPGLVPCAPAHTRPWDQPPSRRISSVGVPTTEIESREERLKEQRRALPDGPGVYLFRDAKRKVLYVGKALSLRKRVAGHFGKPRAEMVSHVHDIEFIATETEAEALLAEQEFIKRHRPVFNVRLRDDKSYPYIGISLDEDYPRIYFTRERHRRNRVYFGPFSNAKRVRETLDLLGKVFQYRTCDGPEPGRASGSPCLDYYIKRCQAPCVGYISKEDYRANVDTIIDFLSGRYRLIERALDDGMKKASEAQEFEQAAMLRNRLKAVRSLLERQRVANESVGTLDAIGVAGEGADANAQVFQVRDGVLQDRQSFYLENAARRDEGEVAEEFVLQYYASAIAVPPQVIVPRSVAATARWRRRSPSAAARPSRSATPSAATSAASSTWPSATRGWRSTRTGCAQSAAAPSASRRSTGSSAPSAWRRSRCGSSASTSPT